MLNKMKINQLKHSSFPGQSIMEMALMLPILLVLIIGALEFGRLIYTKNVLTNAAREGAYYITTHQSDSNKNANTVSAATTEANNSGISIPDLTVSITPKNCCTPGVYSIEVTAGTKVHDLLILGILGNVFSITSTNVAEYPLSSSVEMMVQ